MERFYSFVVQSNRVSRIANEAQLPSPVSEAAGHLPRELSSFSRPYDHSPVPEKTVSGAQCRVIALSLMIAHPLGHR
jgi:hypothetical protein